MPKQSQTSITSIRLVFLLIVMLLIACVSRTHPQTDTFKAHREKMVREQIIARGVTDQKVLDAMRKVERHLFVPKDLVGHAYEDHPLPIGYGQTISQPYIVAFMTEALQLDKTSRVLEIGTGSGYQAAVLGELCDSVFSVEIVAPLSQRAATLLNLLGYTNVKVKTGDGYMGWKENAPFDAIIVTCAPTCVPEPLKEQLKEGGKMIIPVGERNVQHLVLLTKHNDKLIEKSVLPVRFVPMVNTQDQIY